MALIEGTISSFETTSSSSFEPSPGDFRRSPSQSSSSSRAAYGRHLYVRPPKPIFFPSFEDPEEHVSETKRHLKVRTTLFLLLEDGFSSRAAIGSDQFMYWDPTDPKKCLSPDVFVRLGAVNEAFDNWKVWERGAPDLAVEIVSKSDRPEDQWDVKFARYVATGIREVVRFDPEDREQPVRIWDRIEGDLLERSPDDPDLLECTALGLFWAVVPSDVVLTLRLARDRDGKDLLATPDEDRVRLQEELQEERRARALAEHERLLAEQNAREAEQNAREQSRAREKTERERDALAAEVEQLRAELARRRAGGE